MRLLLTLALTFFLTACQTVAPPVPATDGERAAEAEQLIRYSLTERLMQNTQSVYRDQIISMFANNKDAANEVSRIVDEELKKLDEPEHQRLVEGLVPIYRRIFTAEEIHQLLSFYQTEVARKSIRVSGQIAADSQQYVRGWSENFGNVLLEGVDKQLSAAGIKLEQ